MFLISNENINLFVQNIIWLINDLWNSNLEETKNWNRKVCEIHEKKTILKWISIYFHIQTSIRNLITRALNDVYPMNITRKLVKCCRSRNLTKVFSIARLKMSWWMKWKEMKLKSITSNSWQWVSEQTSSSRYVFHQIFVNVISKNCRPVINQWSIICT